MEVQLAIIYLLEGLLSVEDARADSFTLNAWLLFAVLQVLEAEALDNVEGVPPPPSLDELQAILDDIAAKLRSCLDDAGNDQERARCLLLASEGVMQALEAELPALFVPADWRIAWMGVEG